MGHFDPQSFGQFVLENEIVGFFEKPMTLKSNRVSHWYVNWRRATNDAFLMDQLAEYVIQFVADLEVQTDCIFGVPEGATKTALIAQYKWAKASKDFGRDSHRLAMGRAKPKDHGAPSDKYFVGSPKGKTLVLEDVTTTGGSLVKAIENLLEQKVEVVGAVGLTNRMERPLEPEQGESVSDRIIKAFDGKVPYFYMSSATDLLPLAASALKPDPRVLKAIEYEYQQYGVEPISLQVH